MTVAEAGTVRQGAERLAMTQPALSKQLQRLQRDLGVALFVREGRVLRLTPAGEALLADASQLLDEADSVTERTRRAATGEATLVVLAFVAGTVELASRVLQASLDREDLNVRLLRVEWTDQTASLLEGRADVALTRMPLDSTDVAHEVLYTEPRVAGFACTHRLAGRLSVNLADLDNEPILTTANQTDYWTVNPRPGGERPILGPVADTLEEMFAVVASGACMCITPASVALAYSHPSISWVSITDLEPCAAAIAWPKRTMSAAAAKVIDIARDVAAIRSLAGRDATPRDEIVSRWEPPASSTTTPYAR